jgi:hypothetical protein
MPLDTRLPLLAGQFKPITYQAPSQANMLAEVAQAASAMQGLQRNAMAMRQEREKEQRVGSLSQMLSQLAASGETPTSLREMGQALVSSQMPEFMTKGMTLIQRAGELEQALRQQETDEAEMARIFGGAAPAGVGAPVAPATAAAQPSAVPAAMPSPMPAPVANALAQGPGQSSMIAGGPQGVAQASPVGGGVGAPMLTLNQPFDRTRSLRQKLRDLQNEIVDDIAAIQYMEGAFEDVNEDDVGRDAALKSLPRLKMVLGDRQREAAKIEALINAESQQQPSVAQAVAPVALAEPAPASAPQPQPAPVVAPRAAAPAGVQVAGPMVAGAAPAAGEDEISALEARRERVRTSRDLSAARKKDEIAEIDRKLGILREQNKPTELLRNYQAAVAQGYRGTIEDFRKSGAQQISVETKVNAFVPASEQAQKDYIGNIAEERKALRNAPDTLANISEARKLIPSAAAFMGTGGEPLLAAASFLNNRLGFGIKTEGVRDATVLRTRLFESILENLKKLDSQPSQEQQRVMQQALGSLGTDPNALPLVLDKMEEAVRSRVDRYNVDVAEAEKRGVKFPFRPQINLPSRFSAQDQQALDWANANPSDSRAAQIKQRLGVK